jgi:hypothetical protein
MPYVPVTWVDGVVPINAANLNKMEDGIEALDALPKIPTPLVEGRWLTVSGGVMVWQTLPPAAGVDYEGAWSAAIAYQAGDVVNHNGVEYLAVNPSTGQTPPSAGIALVTALPGSPQDGLEVILTDSLTAGTFHWRLRYVAARATNKWVFVGGSPLQASVDTSETTASAAYAALASAGPSVVVPVAGDYEISVESLQTGASNNADAQRLHSFDVGATGAIDNDAAWSTNPTTVGTSIRVSATRRKAGIPAGAAIVSKYKRAGLSTAAVGFAYRRIAAVPVAVGG